MDDDTQIVLRGLEYHRNKLVAQLADLDQRISGLARPKPKQAAKAKRAARGANVEALLEWGRQHGGRLDLQQFRLANPQFPSTATYPSSGTIHAMVKRRQIKGTRGHGIYHLR